MLRGGGGGERKKVRVNLRDRQIVELWASEGGLRGVIEGFFCYGERKIFRSIWERWLLGLEYMFVGR